MIPAAAKRSQTVRQALQQRAWCRQINGRLSVPTISEYIALWHVIENVHLTDSPDRLMWRWSSDGQFSVRSAYEALHLPSHAMPWSALVLETWAPLKIKLFLWLAFRRRHWTADRRLRHGLDAHDSCLLCGQLPSTMNADKYGSATASWIGGKHGARCGQGAASKAQTPTLPLSPGNCGRKGMQDSSEGQRRSRHSCWR